MIAVRSTVLPMPQRDSAPALSTRLCGLLWIVQGGSASRLVADRLARARSTNNLSSRTFTAVLLATGLLSIGTVISLVLGAVLAMLGGIATELWKQRNARRAAARIVYNELRLNFHFILNGRMGDVMPSALKRQLR